jgi:hypothetical protein
MYVKKTSGRRIRAAFASGAAVALALLGAAPAHAAGGSPTTPTELFNAYQACSTDASAPVYVAGRDGLVVEGITADTDSGVTQLTEQFQLWPVSDPAQIVTGSDAYAQVGYEATANLSPLTDGQTYAWQARTVDASGAASAWSAPCYVADDDTAPSSAPTVTSANYPTGQADQGGAPVQFTFGANGVSDVAGYEYTWTDSFPVPGVAYIGAHGIPSFQSPYSNPKYATAATSPGGSATVDLIPPQGGGYFTLWVMSLDRSFNESPVTSYSFWVKPEAPTITKLSDPAQYDTPAAFMLNADPKIQAISPVVSFTVTDLSSPSGTPTTVKASADGSAVLKMPLGGSYGADFMVSSTSADGWVSSQQWWSTGYVDTSPTVSSDVYVENGSSGGTGTPGTFTFAPKVKGVVSYTYSVNWGTGTTVKADGQGDAQISWTPPQSGWYDLEVFATTKDGTQLAPYDYFFTVN